MKRRNILISAGGLLGGSAVLGTGAFTSVTADRNADIAVTTEDSAYLAIEPTAAGTYDNNVYADSGSGNQIRLDFNAVTGVDQSQGDAGAQGVGLDSVYTLDNIFKITNQGTQEIYVWAQINSGDVSNAPLDDIYLYPGSSSDTPIEGPLGSSSRNNVVSVDVGNTQRFGVYIDVKDNQSTADNTESKTYDGTSTDELKLRTNGDQPNSTNSV